MGATKPEQAGECPRLSGQDPGSREHLDEPQALPTEPSGSVCLRGGSGRSAVEAGQALRGGFLSPKAPCPGGHPCSPESRASAVSSSSSPLAAGRQSRPGPEEPAQPHCTGRCAFAGAWALPSPHPTRASSRVPPGPLASPLHTWAPKAERS